MTYVNSHIGEIARAFLLTETTMGAADLARQAQDRRGAHPLLRAARLGPAGRLGGVLGVVYLIFNEGYRATAGDRLVRDELCREAIRLGACWRS